MPVVIPQRAGASATTQAPSGATLAGPQAVHFGNPVSWLIAIVLFAAGVTLTVLSGYVIPVIAGAVLGIVALVSLQIAQAWEKAVALRPRFFAHWPWVPSVPGVW